MDNPELNYFNTDSPDTTGDVKYWDTNKSTDNTSLGGLQLQYPLDDYTVKILKSFLTSNNTASGVTSITGGTGINASATTGPITLTNTGVTSATGGTGISVSASTGGITIGNTGVVSLIAGTSVSVSSSSGNITVGFTGGGAGGSGINFLGSAIWASGTSITVSALPAATNLLIYTRATSDAGTVNSYLWFNNDRATNYSSRLSHNFGAGSTQISDSDGCIIGGDMGAGDYMDSVITISNNATTIKNIQSSSSGSGSRTAAPQTSTAFGIWDNTTNSISSITLRLGSGANLVTGSYMYVFGY